MNLLDWSVIVVYLAGMIGFSVFLSRGQADESDYYVGGRDISWWAVGISTMATQTSAVGFISIPAFVAVREGGGLTWLQGELAVPLAMIFIMVFLIPFFRRLELISIYEYLERRFSRSTRYFLAGVFLLSRGLATGVGLYAAALVLAVCFETEVWIMIVVMGVVTLIYDTIGGIKAVIYSDVVQMVILVGGLIICIVYALSDVGGWHAALATHDPARFKAIDPSWGLAKSGGFPFWAFLFGGFFLYGSYYGCDQTQAQRELSAPSLAHTKYSLVFNGFARLPLTLAYLALGLAVGAVFAPGTEAASLLPAAKPDQMIPLFVLHFVPHGLKALIFAAILAAAMSSLDSSLNSLSASTMQDFVERFLPTDDPARRLRQSKYTTVAWGVLIILFAFLLGGQETVVERVNRIGSAFYGPILAAFVTGVTVRRVTAPGMIAGIIGGVATNLILWLAIPQVFWMWWNLSGCVVTMVVALGVSLVYQPATRPDLKGLIVWDTQVWPRERRWLPLYGLLAAYFVGMLWLCNELPGWLTT